MGVLGKMGMDERNLSYVIFSYSGQQHHTMPFLAVHHNFQRTLETHMAHILSFLDGMPAVEDFFLHPLN